MERPGQPIYSPDGQFLWDGHRWVRVTAGLPVATGPRRSAALHFFASFILVGLGTIFAGKVGKGIVLFILGNGSLVGATVLSFSLAHSCDLTLGQPSHCGPGYPAAAVALTAVVLALTGFLLWVYGLFDAVASTREWNREHGWSR
jgi:uncharacterized membrane protein SpoIIM required for sporulation